MKLAIGILAALGLSGVITASLVFSADSVVGSSDIGTLSNIHIDVPDLEDLVQSVLHEIQEVEVELTDTCVSDNKLFQFSVPDGAEFITDGSYYIDDSDAEGIVYTWDKGLLNQISISVVDLLGFEISNDIMEEIDAVEFFSGMEEVIKSATGTSVESEPMRRVEIAGVDGYAQMCIAKFGDTRWVFEVYYFVKDDVFVTPSMFCLESQYEKEEQVFIAMMNSFEVTR